MASIFELRDEIGEMLNGSTSTFITFGMRNSGNICQCRTLLTPEREQHKQNRYHVLLIPGNRE
jgi:hypothetical protein